MILQKRPEVLLQLYGENYDFFGVHKVKIQNYYQVSKNQVMQHHIFGVFKHEKTFGAVVLVITHSVMKFKPIFIHFSWSIRMIHYYIKTNKQRISRKTKYNSSQSLDRLLHYLIQSY